MVGTENQTDLLYQAFANKGPAIQAALLTGAQDLFASLALIELVWIVGWSVAHKSDVFDMLIAVTRWVIAIGFWFFLFQHWAQMAKAIVDTFRQWGNAASQAAGGSANMMPMGFLAVGLDLWHALLSATGYLSPIVSAALIIAGLIDTVIFAWVAAIIMLVLIEAFLASYLGSVMIAFGASGFTRDFASSPIRYVLAVGMKLLTLQVIAGIAEGIVRTFATQVQSAGGGQVGWDDVGVMIVVPIILATLAWIAPKIAQDIIIGSHMSTGAGIVATASALARAAVGALASGSGVGAAGVAGYQLAGRRIEAKDAGGMSTLSGQTMALGMAVGNVAKATAADVGHRLTGNYQAAHGVRGWRVASSLKDSGKKTGSFG